MTATLTRRLLATPNVLFRHSFNAPDSAVGLGTADTGQVLASGTCGISGGQAYFLGGFAGRYLTPQLGALNVDVECSVMSPDLANTQVGILARAVDTSNFIEMRPSGLSNLILFVDVAGSGNVRANISLAFSNSVFYKLRLRCLGDFIIGHVDGVERFTYTLTPTESAALSVPGATAIGLRQAGTANANLRFDDLVARRIG